MRKPVTVALIVAVLLGGVPALRLTGITPGSAAAPAYLTAPVARGSVEVSVLAEGRLKPSNLVAVGAQVSGRITALAVKVGDRVGQGDLIAEIDSVTQKTTCARPRRRSPTSRLNWSRSGRCWRWRKRCSPGSRI